MGVNTMLGLANQSGSCGQADRKRSINELMNVMKAGRSFYAISAAVCPGV